MKRIAAVAVLLLAAFPAMSASSDIVETEGGGVRLVVESQTRADGTLRGAIEIDLKPGWKTYWRDPGDAGIPPTIEAPAPVTAAEILYPAPRRFDDGVSVWAGYDAPVALPVVFTLAASPATLSAHVFLGVCEAICIPVDARFAIDLGDASAEDDAAVAAAFAALPATAGDQNGVRSVALDGKRLTFATDATDDAELFVAAPSGWSFGTPERQGGGVFALDILFQPKDTALSGHAVAWTLVAPGGATSGALTIP